MRTWYRASVSGSGCSHGMNAVITAPGRWIKDRVRPTIDHPSPSCESRSALEPGRIPSQEREHLMDILVIGATGGSGRAVCDALLERGHRVTALARHATAVSPRPSLNPIDGDATDADLLDRVMLGHDAVVVTLGISEPTLRVRVRGAQRTPNDVRSRGTAAVVAAARRAGIRRIVVQSSYGVGETRDLIGV